MNRNIQYLTETYHDLQNYKLNLGLYLDLKTKYTDNILHIIMLVYLDQRNIDNVGISNLVVFI